MIKDIEHDSSAQLRSGNGVEMVAKQCIVEDGRLVSRERNAIDREFILGHVNVVQCITRT